MYKIINIVRIGAAIAAFWVLAGLAPPVRSADFPHLVRFRGKQETFNTYYDFALRDCKVWFRPRNDTTAQWKPMKLCRKLKCPREISADSDRMVALDEENTIFYITGILKTASGEYKCTRRWGAPFSQGLGMQVPADNRAWSFSQLCPIEDRYYQAFNGNKHDVGKGVVNIYILSTDGQRITYIDPWLPNDLSFEVGSPHRARFRSVNISASGSSIFIINKYGDMYTILYDFDLAGADDFFFNYTYEPDKHIAPDTSKVVHRKVPRPLPLPGWVKQPKITGTITDRITIFKVPPGTYHRTLMVEGKDSLGNTGYYTKDINAGAWEFVPTGEPLQGSLLENSPGDRSVETLGPDESRAYRCTEKNVTIDISDFNLYWPWSTFIITVKGCRPCTLDLHTHEVIRQFTRERGYKKKRVLLRGAVKVPDRVKAERKTLEKPVKEFLKEHFADRTYTRVKVWAKHSYLKIIDPYDFKWKFKPVSGR